MVCRARYGGIRSGTSFEFLSSGFAGLAFRHFDNQQARRLSRSTLLRGAVFYVHICGRCR